MPESNGPATADRYGVIGNPVAHSFSPIIHREFARQTGHNIRYERLLVESFDLADSVYRLRDHGFCGLNVTLPHKAAVVELADSVSERAQTAGAANTLSFADDRILADNTDGVGLLTDLVQNLGLQLEGTRIVVIGAGGAVRGILGPLLDAGPSLITIANRTVETAEALAEKFRAIGPVAACSIPDVADLEPADLLINATAASYTGDDLIVPAEVVSERTFCYDLSYSQDETAFETWARAQAPAACTQGWGMLIEQAAESFHVWRGVRPDTKRLLEQVPFNAL